MKYRHLLALSWSALGACAGGGINYTLSSVPQEGGVRFTQITTEADRIVAPSVSPSREFGLVYGVVKPFDVSPDGNTLAFLGSKGDKVNIFLKSTTGGVATTQRTFRDTVYDVSYSADGQRIAFTDFRNKRWNVFEISAIQGSAIKQLTNFEQVSRYPVYSATGNKLMFVQYEPSTVTATPSKGAAPAKAADQKKATAQTKAAADARAAADAKAAAAATPVTIMRYYVWEVDLDKNSFTQYCEGFAPAISPDGKRLAVTRNSPDHGNAEIWVIDLATGTETLVASSKDQVYVQPSFSPDGRRIVFTGLTKQERSRPTNFDIYVVDTDGSNITQLTFHPGDDLAGRFSPDGKSVYFLSKRGNAKGTWNVWRMDFMR